MGIGVVILEAASGASIGEYLGIGTNNIAELVAIERGLETPTGADAATAACASTPTPSYSIGVLSKGWKAKANQELIARLRKRLVTMPNVEFVKVAGHAGIPENERCDELATSAISRRS